MEDVMRKPRRGRIRTILSTTTGPHIFGSIYHKIIFFPSAAWYLRKELKDCDSVLDLGCGGNSVLRYATHRFWSIGAELWKESLVESKGKRIHDEYIMADLTKLELKDKSVDAVILLEVLEHLTKEEGPELLAKMSKVARKKIVITTPNGFIPQGGDTNRYQLHKSGWEMPELEELGFARFRGSGGLKSFGRKFESQFLFMVVQSMPQKVAYLAPRKANGLICTKSIEKE